MDRRGALALVLLVLGCSSPVSSAVRAFEHGDLPRAAGRLRALEPEFRELELAEQARYALYRGLAELALGDVREADRWLSLLKHALDREPELLSAAERGRLFAAWRSMGRLPGE